MINKIQNKIKQFTYRLETSHQLQEDHMSLLQLHKMFDNQLFLPLTTWSISPKEILHFCNDIIINDRKNIVEFGAGFSTICIAQLLKISKKKANFISVENNAAWAADLRRILQDMELQDFVQIIDAPITAVPEKFAKAKQEKWYDTEILKTQISAAVDLVIVDGPFGGTTPFARYSAIPFLQEKLAADYSIFLDDSSRPEEKAIAQDWHKLLGGEIRNHKRYTCFTSTTGFDVGPYGIKYKI